MRYPSGIHWGDITEAGLYVYLEDRMKLADLAQTPHQQLLAHLGPHLATMY